MTKWVAYNEHDELIRAMHKIEELEAALKHATSMEKCWKASAEALADVANEKDVEIENLTAVVEAAEHYIQCVEAGHHGPGGAITKRALKNLHEEVTAYQEAKL